MLGITVDGLDALRRRLAAADKNVAKGLGRAGKSAADIVVAAARTKVPVRSGRARDSLRAVILRGGAGIRGGGAKAPYFGFLDYGNKVDRGGGVGRGDSQVREYLKGGRIVYPAVREKRDEAIDVYVEAMKDLLREAALL